MTFPVHIPIFGHPVHPHLFFELLAYPAGFQLWLLLRKRSGLNLDVEKRLWLLAWAILGAALGAKVLAFVEHLNYIREHAGELKTWAGGKTIVGGLLGGWAGVEYAKKRLGIRGSTGDSYIYPLIVGMVLGRVGCFLTGLDDKTYGNPTSLPWGIDFGDGVPRHPAQLYEIGFLLLAACGFAVVRRPFAPGTRFRIFLATYLAFRFGVEFIKPVYAPYLGMSAIQLACLLGIVACARGLTKERRSTSQAPSLNSGADPLTTDL